MSEDPIQDLLRSLPREKASEGFTQRVMGRLDEVKPPPFFQPRLALAASLLFVVAVWVGADRWYAARQDEQRTERIQTIRTEIEQLQKDILLLRDLAPVLYLGGDKDVDFVLDLRQLVKEEKEGSAQPTSFETSDESLKKGENPK